MRFAKTIVVAMLLLGFATSARAENVGTLIGEYIGLLAEEQIADEYIMKPFDKDILEAKFSQVGLL